MKKFETPVMVELNINETANGFFDCYCESPLDILTNDSKSEQKPATTDPDKDESKIS